jgi:hypothetical protein
MPGDIISESAGDFVGICRLLARAAAMMKGGRVPAIARMVIGESRNFPDLARADHGIRTLTASKST